jgi:hypothetical protein
VDISQIDFKLSCIQESVNSVGDKLFDSKRNLSLRLKLMAFNIGCVRADIERAAGQGERQNTSDNSAMVPCRAHDIVDAGCCCVEGWMCGSKPCTVARHQ